MVKPKLKEVGYKYEDGKFNALYTINWINKVLEDHVQRNGKTYWDMAKEIREHDKLVEQGKIKVIEDKDLPMTQIDFDTPDPNYKRQGSINKDASKDIIDIDIDLEKLADKTFGYDNPITQQQAESETDVDEENMSYNDAMREAMKQLDEKTKNNPLWQIEQTAQAHSKA